MSHYFKDCNSPEEIKARYSSLLKRQSPGNGTTEGENSTIERQYRETLQAAQQRPKLPPLFHVDKPYSYQGNPVTYFQRDGFYYKFRKANGVVISIDEKHLYLIK